MSCIAAKAVLKPSPMANGCVMSLPAIFTSRNSFPQISKPIKLNLACSYSSSLPTSLSLKKKTHLLTFVAQASEEGNTVAVEEEGASFNWGSTDPGAVGGAGESAAEEESYPEASEEAKIFVGNLPFDFDSGNLAQLFEQAGVVEIAEVIYNRETDQSRGFGFVTMSTVEEAEKAVQLFNRYDLGGRILNVNKAAPRGSRPERTPRAFEPSFRIYVGNLPWDVDNARLEQVFSEYGKVVDARVVLDRETNRSRGFGFVTMSSEAERNDAISNLDGESMGGRAIRVNVAEERPPRRAF